MGTYQKTCQICGLQFATVNPRQKYCKGCNKYAPTGRRQAPTEEIVCAKCGKTIKVTPYQKYNWKWGLYGKRYCSSKCFKEIYAHCCVCGKSLVDREYFDFMHVEHQYCSPECQKKHDDKRAIEIGRITKCPICGNEFPNYYRTKKYCSPECKKIAVKKKYEEKKKKV